MGKRGNGEGTIYKRKDGTWACQTTLGTNELTGKPIRKTFYGKQRKEVAEKLSEFIKIQQLPAKAGRLVND